MQSMHDAVVPMIKWAYLGCIMQWCYIIDACLLVCISPMLYQTLQCVNGPSLSSMVNSLSS